MREAEALLRRGAELFNAGRPAEAVEVFARAARLGAGPKAGCFLGHSLHAAGRAAEAQSAFRKVLKTSPRFAPAALGLAGVLRSAGRADEALSVLAAAPGPEARRAYAAALKERALAEEGAGRLEGAERAWTALSALSPREPEPRRALASCRRALSRERAARGDAPGARAAAELAFEADGGVDARAELVAALRGEAAALASAGKPEKARVPLERALRLSPDDAQAAAALAALLREEASRAEAAARFSAARALLARAETLSTAGPRARAERFRELVRGLRYADAFAEGERLLDARPTLWDLRAFWAPWDIPRLERDRAKHLAAVQPLAARSRPSPWALYYRGFLLGGPEGLEDFARLARADSRRYGWMRGRAGQSCLLLGRHADAARHLEAASRARPLDWRFLDFLAQARLALGQEKRAFAAIERAKFAAPREELADVLLARARLSLSTGRRDEARFAADWARALGSPGAAAVLKSAGRRKA